MILDVDYAGIDRMRERDSSARAEQTKNRRTSDTTYAQARLSQLDESWKRLREGDARR